MHHGDPYAALVCYIKPLGCKSAAPVIEKKNVVVPQLLLLTERIVHKAFVMARESKPVPLYPYMLHSFDRNIENRNIEILKRYANRAYFLRLRRMLSRIQKIIKKYRKQFDRHKRHVVHAYGVFIGGFLQNVLDRRSFSELCASYRLVPGEPLVLSQHLADDGRNPVSALGPRKINGNRFFASVTVYTYLGIIAAEVYPHA